MEGVLFVEAGSPLLPGPGLGPVVLLQGLNSYKFLQMEIIANYSNKFTQKYAKLLAYVFACSHSVCQISPSPNLYVQERLANF